MSTDSDQSQVGVLAFGDFYVDAVKRLLLTVDGKSVPLMPKAFDTLLYLVERSGKVVSKDELMLAIWADRVVEENNLTQNISTLRRVLGEKHGENRFIATVPGHGYKFVAEVRKRDFAEKAVASLRTTVPLPETVAQSSPQLLPQSVVQSSSQPDSRFSAEKARGEIADDTKNPSLRWLVALALICSVGVSLAAAYFWRGIATPADPQDLGQRRIAHHAL